MKIGNQNQIFNRRDWIAAAGGKNALILGQLFGVISKRSYVPILGYKIADLSRLTNLSVRTIRRTIKKLTDEAFLRLVKNTGRRKIYVAAYPNQSLAEALKIARASLGKIRSNYPWMGAAIEEKMATLTGQNGHSDRSKWPVSPPCSIINKELIRDLRGARGAKKGRLPTESQAEIFEADFTPGDKKTPAKTATAKSATAARSSSKTALEKAVDKLQSPRKDEILAAWSIYYDDAAAGKVNNKIARLGRNFAPRALVNILISDGYEYATTDPGEIKKGIDIDPLWSATASRLATAKNEKLKRKKQQIENLSAAVMAAKKQLWKIQGEIIDAEAELKDCRENPKPAEIFLPRKITNSERKKVAKRLPKIDVAAELKKLAVGMF